MSTNIRLNIAWAPLVNSASPLAAKTAFALKRSKAGSVIL